MLQWLLQRNNSCSHRRKSQHDQMEKPSKKKAIKHTKLCYRIKYLELTMLIFCMKSTIAKTITNLSNCTQECRSRLRTIPACNLPNLAEVVPVLKVVQKVNTAGIYHLFFLQMKTQKQVLIKQNLLFLNLLTAQVKPATARITALRSNFSLTSHLKNRIAFLTYLGKASSMKTVQCRVSVYQRT